MTTTKPRTESARIASLEEAQTSFGRELSGLREEFHNFAAEMRRGVAQMGRVAWSPLIGLAGLAVTIIIAVVAMGASGPLRDLDRHEMILDGLRTRAEAVLATRFSDVDGRRLEDTLRAEIRSLEQRLQEHMADGHPHRVVELVEGIGNRVERLEAVEARRTNE